MLKTESPIGFKLFQDEWRIQKQIKNDNVVGFIEYFETDQNCFLVLEYCDEGDLE
jgi:serine/threonine protein kinase